MRTWARSLAHLTTGVLLVASLGVTSSRAEVVALLTSDGRFVRTEVNVVHQSRLTSVWLSPDGRRARRDRFTRVTLNESGALRGDGVPSVAVHPISGLPWAVWSLNENGDAELAVSLFDGRNWSSPYLLGAAANGIADLEPKLLFTPAGKPIVIWWRMSSDGTDQSVWLTARSNGTWLHPARLSGIRTRASRPAVLLKGSDLVLAFESNEGVQIRTLPADAPALGGTETAGGAEGPDPPTRRDDTRPPECQVIGCDGN